MNKLNRIAMSGAAAAALVAPVLAGPAHAGFDATITAHATDSHVRSGEQFRVHGKYLLGDGTPVTNRMVRVQSKNANGSWTTIRGAHLRTNSEGRYRIRVILFRKGERKLRVRAQGPDANTSPIRSRPFTVRVR
ncbi:MAG: hypothetical protein ACRDO7_10780 [Nocardioidaceae bacterium]